jgi:signal transduction histidine kinase/CheY-like chemotaxis protein/purine-cytosine permease-like protein
MGCWVRSTFAWITNPFSTLGDTKVRPLKAPHLIFPIRREYNTLAGNETLEDYALRFTATRARRWSIRRVAATALGATSFLALEAIAASLTLNYGVTNTLWAIFAVSLVIFLIGFPIVLAAARHGLDIDLLTRGAGFGYIGSTVTSLIYASFTFLFFAIEAAIMASALEALFAIPLSLGYVLCALGVIPIVTHGITAISRFQIVTQWFWLCLQILALVVVYVHFSDQADAWLAYTPETQASAASFQLTLFGAASAALFAMIAQIGEQVDYLRFMPARTRNHRRQWWFWLIAAGPGWTVIGVIKMLFGSFLAYLVISNYGSALLATDPVHLYRFAFQPLFQSEALALWLAGFFVVISQMKINVTNAYAGSIAWSNFFSRLTHSHPGRVVWLVFNVIIALLLMELGIYRALESILGVFAVVAVSWLATLAADLCINRPLGLRPPTVEFKRAYLYDVNPVGVISMLVASIAGISAYLGTFGPQVQALSHFISALLPFLVAPLVAFATDGRYYIARSPVGLGEESTHVCCICETTFETEDTSFCPAYDGPICSLCCSLDSRCMDLCKPGSRFNDQLHTALNAVLPARVLDRIPPDVVRFVLAFGTAALVMAGLFAVIYFQMEPANPGERLVLERALMTLYFLLLTGCGVFVWLYLLAQESSELAVQETSRQTRRLLEEIDAHQVTDLALQKAKEIAERANEAKNRYLAGISHELRTPLQSIIGFAQLLARRVDIAPRHGHALQVIRRNGEHLTDLIEGLLDISRIEAGRLELMREAVPLGEMLQQIVDMFQAMAAHKGISFRYVSTGQLPGRVYTDPRRLRQILINLLSNAIKYTPDGSVEFHASWRNQVARFEIIDTGIGIAADDLGRIFEPFERIHNQHLPHVHGTGLGLTIVKLMTEIMGGELRVASEPGKGSRFGVSLMLSSVEVRATPVYIPQAFTGYRGQRRHVMVVDDDPDFRQLIAELLGSLGFLVTAAGSAAQCTTELEDVEPDLMLLDVNLPDGNGLELASVLRRREHHFPIIIVSAQVHEQPGRPGITADHDSYLVKPVTEQLLFETIGELLRLDWASGPQIATSNDPPRVEASGGAADAVSNDADAAVSGGVAAVHPSIQELISCARMGYRSGVLVLLDEVEGARLLPANTIQTLRLFARTMRFALIADLLESVDLEQHWRRTDEVEDQTEKPNGS